MAKTTSSKMMDEIMSSFKSMSDASSKAMTLEEMFSFEKSMEQKLSEYRKQLQREEIAQQERLERKVFERIQELKAQGIKVTSDMEIKLHKEAIAKQAEQRLKAQNELWKKELEAIKKDPRLQGTKARLGSMQRQYNENSEMLKLYSEMLKAGQELSEEQKGDKQRRELEQKRISQESRSTQITQGLINALQGLTNSVNRSMDKYSELQKGTNARLQGRGLDIAGRLESAFSGRSPANTFGMLEKNLSSAVGVNPYFKTETMLTNLSNLINEGISTNLEQRAFLQTASENIATTFNVANSALLRIIRLQQQDSTAARLGMEAYLTKFLNATVDNTEYLNKTFDSVQEALVEASSHMTLAGSTELEYVIQKWLGSLVGVGMSESTATNIAQALGYLGSGNVEALNNTALQNLLVMASSRGNMSYANLLTGGLSAADADTLMSNLVAYMIEIERSGNNVVKSQFANTFGISFSDLAAAANLAPSLGSIYGNRMGFADMYSELAGQLMMIPLRMSTSSQFDTLWSNLEFGVGKEIAANPILASMWKVTDLIQQNTGGINIPFLSAAGFGMDLNTTVENLVKLGLVGTSSLGMIGEAISGMQTSFAPASALLKLGISPITTAVRRGSGISSYSGLTTSMSSTQQVGQGGGSEIASSVLGQAKKEAQESSGAGEEEEEELKRASLNIYKYLTESFDSKMDRLLGYVDDVESKMDNILLNMTTGVS